MKTFRLIGAALLAVLMCANFASCSKDDDAATTDGGGNDEGGNQEVTVSEKKLVKMVSNEETYTFSYDGEGRLSSATYNDSDGDIENSKFIWGDDAVVVKYEYEDGNGDNHTETYTLKNGLVQSWSADYHNGHHTEGTYYYNSSNRLIKAAFTHHLGYTVNAVWDKDKLVSVDTNDTYEAILTYGETCKKGYFPLISDVIGLGDVLFMAHPEIVGMRTNQLPNTYLPDDEEISMTYEYDKEGYISKIKLKDNDGNTDTYTLTWK